MIKLESLILLLLFVTTGSTYAQLYAPEIKVQETTNNRIEIGKKTVPADLIISGNVYAGNAHSYWGGFKANTPEGEKKWGFQQNERFFAGLGGNVYNRGFSANALGIFNGSTTAEDVFLYNENDAAGDFLVLKANGKVGINRTNPEGTLDVAWRTGANATAVFRGSTYPSYFNHNNEEHTYIRGGKAGSNVIIGDNPNARVGIGGVYQPSEKLHVAGNVLANNVSVTSDKKLKKDIREYDQGLALVKQIRPKKYKRKPQVEKVVKFSYDGTQTKEDVEEGIVIEDNREYIGVVAQELQEIAPELVGSFTDEQGEATLTIDQTALTYVLINAVKEQQLEIEALRQEMQSFKTEKDK